MQDIIDWEYNSRVLYVFWVYIIVYVLDVIAIVYFIVTYIPLLKHDVTPKDEDLENIILWANILNFTECLFLIKVILDVITYNRFRNKEEGFYY